VERLREIWRTLAASPSIGLPASGRCQRQTVDIPTTFTAGDYALLCFVPDAKDGKPHLAHGMVKQFSVK